MDWGAWSREAVSQIGARTCELLERHRIPTGSAYHWDLDAAAIVIGGVRFRLVAIGTVVDDSFLWSWANDSIPEISKKGLEQVRQFGSQNDLGLLMDECAPGGVAQGKECLAIAGRVLDAQGGWIDQTDSGFILFALFELGGASN